MPIYSIQHTDRHTQKWSILNWNAESPAFALRVWTTWASFGWTLSIVLVHLRSAWTGCGASPLWASNKSGCRPVAMDGSWGVCGFVDLLLEYLMKSLASPDDLHWPGGGESWRTWVLAYSEFGVQYVCAKWSHVCVCGRLFKRVEY